MLNDQQFLADFHSLPLDKQVTVIDFIQFLKARSEQTLQTPTIVYRQPPPELRGSVTVNCDLLEPVAEQNGESAKG